ncbi:hypothetical protein KSD_52330 [Ktedonobacter sp. SOSP1-85]|uniref:hypothetical protein n=1 Tax=Ktedonobacter sp. SOSP1-85 TaxID=2778367 RepID=UPI00191522A1|nr:hypothetical protein [Ktedonobacter sp. SOSP1-85]GHO77462.1 hypothetical protein KSD_52330 [Ktedonobacter sp. SOSP1-85]
MNRRSHQEETDAFVSFSRALELFKPLNKNAFNYRVRKKEIATKEDESGKTLYGVQSVIAMRNSLLKRLSRIDKQPEVITDWLQPTDIPASLALDQTVYHEMYLAEAEVYMAWRRKNPYISMAAFDARDRRTCYAYIGLIPLPESVILDVLTGKRDEKEITPDEILTYDQPGEYCVLANSAVVHPDYPELISKVIDAIGEYWLKQYPEKRIKRIYAQTVSEDGRIMAQKLYLGPLYVLQDQELIKIEDAYVLDLDGVAASRIIRRFQEKLRAKATYPSK